VRRAALIAVIALAACRPITLETLPRVGRGQVLVPQAVPADTRWRAVAITADSRLAVVGDEAGTLWIFDVVQRQLLAVLGAHLRPVVAVAVVPGDRHAWSVGEDATLCKLDLQRFAIARCLRLAGEVTGVAFSRDVRRVVVGVEAGEILPERSTHLIELEPVRQVRAIDTGAEYAAFSTDGRWIATVAKAWEPIRVWSAVTGRRKAIVPTLAAFGHEPQLARMLGATWAQTPLFWLSRWENGAVTAPRLSEAMRDASVTVAAVSPSRRRVVAISSGGTLEVADAATGTRLHAMTLVRGGIARAAFGSDQIVLLSGDDGALRLDLGTGVVERVGSDAAIADATFQLPAANPAEPNWTAPDGSTAVTSIESYGFGDWPPHGVDIVDAGTRAAIGSVRVVGEVSGGVYSADSAWLAIASGVEMSSPLTIGGMQRGVHVIDVRTGDVVAMATWRSESIGPMQFTPDRRFLVGGEIGCHAVGGDGWCDLVVLDVRRGTTSHLRGHRDAVTSVALSPDGRRALTTSTDRTARIWNLAERTSIAVTMGAGEWLIYDDAGNFEASRKGAALVASVVDGRAVSLEQLAVARNRPGALLAGIGVARPDVLAYFDWRFQERLRAFKVADPKVPILATAAPVVRLTNVVRDGKMVALTAAVTVPARARDELATYQIWVNQVPVFPGAGKPLAGTRAVVDERIELSPGRNRIEIGAWSTAGIESLRASREVEYDGPQRGKTYVVGLGVSTYDNPRYTLKNAASDAVALTAAFARLPDVVTHEPLIDRQVTLEALADVRRFLAQATVDDTVIVFIAGHGTLARDGSSDFLFVPSAFDRRRARATAIPFAAIEGLFTDLAARRRLLLIDACVSGPRDASAATPAAPLPPEHRSRLIAEVDEAEVDPPDPVDPEPTAAVALPPEYIFHRDRMSFVDLGRTTGLVTLGSSRWDEAALESDGWGAGQGAFAHELTRALAGAGDDGDGVLTFDELRRAVEAGVASITGNRQHPTLRTDNVDAGIALRLR
jgi:WD40 repeat protein